jgi:hypothetical protein
MHFLIVYPPVSKMRVQCVQGVQLAEFSNSYAGFLGSCD